MVERLWIAIIVFGLFYIGILLWMWWTLRKRKKLMRFPLGDVPRPAGYSLQKKISELEEKLFIVTMQVVFCLAIGGFVYVQGLVTLWWALALTVPVVIYLFLKLKRVILELSNYNTGLIGEQAVGAVLNNLSSETVRVFHDFPIKEKGKKPWNIDHVVVSHDGVFVIETKTRRKPKTKGENGQEGHEVRYDGGSLHYPMSSENWGVNQAFRNAKWMAEYLTKAIGEPVAAKPVLVLPGWMVHRDGRGQVDVLNHKELYGHFSGRREKPISDTKLKRICHQLEQKCLMDL